MESVKRTHQNKTANGGSLGNRKGSKENTGKGQGGANSAISAA